MVRVEGWGITPPLPRIMATFGMGVFSMVIMEEVEEAKLGTAREAHNDTILAPTCNAVVPGGVHETETWECFINNLALLDESNSLAEHAQHIIDHTKTLGSVDNLLGFMARAAKYVKGSLFERLFTAITRRARLEWGVDIKRRLVVKLPTYEKKFPSKDLVLSQECGLTSLAPRPRLLACILYHCCSSKSEKNLVPPRQGQGPQSTHHGPNGLTT